MSDAFTALAQRQEATERAALRQIPDEDLVAWIATTRREIADLGDLPEDQKWFVDVFRRDLEQAEAEMQRRDLAARIAAGEVRPAITPEVVREVKEKADLVALFEAFGVGLSRNGATFKGRCPWHEDATPSLVIWPGPPGRYRCFGCQARGDAITFTEQMQSVGFVQAVRWLAGQVGISIPEPVRGKRTETTTEATPVHLTDVDKAEMYGRRVAVPVTVVGVGQCFFVPRQIEGVVCVAQNPNEPQCKACGLSRHYTVTLTIDDPLVIASTAIETPRLSKTLAEALWHKARAGKLPHGKPACEKGHLAWGQIVHQPLTELMVYPLAHELHARQDSDLVDELGREYRRKDVFYLGEKSSNVQRFIGYGTVLANPKSQVVTLLIDRLEPLGEDLSFDPSQVRRLDVEDVGGLVEDWARCVTKVYGREEAHLALLLCYASPLYFYWEGELTKGWVEVAFCGDTTTGKGQSTLRTRAALGAGVYAVGESASRAGLLYGIEAGTRGHVLIWGELPQNDGRLLIVDGVNVIPVEEWQKFREARRTGVLLVRRIVSGDHPCRTRLVAIGNPKQAIASYKHPCLALCDLWDDADVARFDVAILFNEADVDVEVINTPPEPGEDADLAWVRHNVLRAWRVSPKDLTFSEEARRAVYAQATRLARKYKAARRIPLLGNDAAKKVARLSLSLALLCGQTTVEEQHVAYIADWLDSLYQRMGLDRYAVEMQKKDRGGSEEEIAATLAWLQERMAESDCLKWLVKDIFDQYANIRLADIVAKAEGLWQEQNIRKRIAELRGKDLVSSSGRGYARTQKFLAVLRKLNTASTSSTSSEICPHFWENGMNAEKTGAYSESGITGTSGTETESDPWDEEVADAS